MSMTKDEALEYLIGEFDWHKLGWTASDALWELNRRLKLLMAMPDRDKEFVAWAALTVEMADALRDRLQKGLNP